METLQQVPLKDVKPSPFHFRTSFDESAMANLVASVQAGGIHEPLLARKVNGHYELVAGHRRLEAAKLAKLTTVPVIAKDLTDAQALEVQIVENEQREDVSELDQAAGFARLMKLDAKTYTVEHLAGRLGLKPASVYLRLKLLALIPEAQQLLRAGTIDAGHGVLIARQPEKAQKELVKWIKDSLKRGRYDDDEPEAPSVRDLKHYIQNHVKVDLFSDAVRDEQPEVAKALDELKAAGKKPVALSRGWGSSDKGALSQHEVRISDKKCPNLEIGYYTTGDQGEIELVDFCRQKQCKVHYPELARQAADKRKAAKQAKETPAQKEKRQAAERKEREKKAREKALSAAVAAAVVNKTKGFDKPLLAHLASRVVHTWQISKFTAILEPLGLAKLASGAHLTEAALAKLSEADLAKLCVLSMISDRVQYQASAVAKEFKIDVKKLQTAAKPEATTAAPAKKAAARKKR